MSRRRVGRGYDGSLNAAEVVRVRVVSTLFVNACKRSSNVNIRVDESAFNLLLR